MELSPAALDLFGRQHGVATLAQLRAAGTGKRTVLSGIRHGALVKVARSVVRLSSHDFDHHSQVMAGWLHAGPKSFVSHFTAGRIHGIRRLPRSRVHLTVLGRCNATTPPWMRTSRTTWMIGGDVVTHPTGFRIASPLRTLHQLAGALTDYRFERAAEDVWHLDLVSPTDAADYLRRMRRQGRTGVGTLERWLQRVAERTRPAQSGLEMDALEAVRLAALPEPELQHPVQLADGSTVFLDLAWPEVEMSVEPGHSWWHGGDLGQRKDQARDRALGEVGWHNIRFDEDMSQDIPGAGRQIAATYRTRIRTR